MAIPAQQARELFTKKLISVYEEVPAPKMFLKNFFRTSVSETKEISVEVFRSNEKIAVDISRGASSNRNKMSKSTERIILPPYYDESTDVTDIEAYDAIAGRGGTPANVGRFIAAVAPKVRMLRDTITRAYELQASQALFDGIVQLKANTNIDYKRKAGSKVDKTASGYWVPANATVDPRKDLEAGCNFIRQNSRYQGGVYNAIMGSQAFAAMTTMPIFKDDANFRRVDYVNITGPLRNAENGIYHGTISAGGYQVNLWTYDEVYDDGSGNIVRYVPDNKVTLIPDNASFDFGFGGTPAVFNTGNAQLPQMIQPVRGEYNIYDIVDPYGMAHNFGVRSAGVAILTAVDQVYTVQVLAS